MSDRKKMVRLNMRVTEEAKDYLERYGELNHCRSQGEAFQLMVREIEQKDSRELVSDQIAQSTANYVIDGLKRQYLDPLRIRTGYADKQTKVLIQMMNHLMVKGDFDDPNIITTDIHSSTALKVSEEKIQKEIEHFKQRKNTREATREGRQETSD